jgi:hypothetical protein
MKNEFGLEIRARILPFSYQSVNRCAHAQKSSKLLI